MILHEGYKSCKEEAEKALNVASEFIKLAVTVFDRFNATEINSVPATV